MKRLHLQLIIQPARAMTETYSLPYVSLHVRVSNIAAVRLYRDSLGFTMEKIKNNHYDDGENGYLMHMELNKFNYNLVDESSFSNPDNSEFRKVKGLQ